ncbi:MAG: helix-turn-helix domain-containing protein [Pseudonocardiales bacterium]|nr:helix-turn-helix domain-containing protein [Pseudonocardiales bacterium]
MTAHPSLGDGWSLPLAQLLAEEIRRLRKVAGLSQPQLGALIGYTTQYVSLAERPKRGLPSAALVRAIDDALGAEGALVALRQRAYAERKAPRPGANDVTASAEAAERGPRTSADPAEVENTNRRELVASAAAIAFGASLDQPVGRIIAAAEEPQVPTRVRAGDVHHVHSAVAMLDDWDMQAGGGVVRHHALAALRWATTMLDASCTPTVRLDLEAAVALLADLAAWVTFDCGDYAAARQLFLLGLHAARESGDLGVRGFIACGLALQEIHTGNWVEGLELTQLASTATDAFTPNAMAMLHTVKAFGYARKQDAAQCHRCIGAAIDTYQPDLLANDPPWIRYFTPAKLEGDLANAMYDLVLGDADVADRATHRLALVDHLSTAFTQYPPERARSKAITATRLATLLCLEGEQHAACQMADEAISLAGQIRSARLVADLRVLLRTVPPGSGFDDHGLDLHHRLSTVLTEMT